MIVPPGNRKPGLMFEQGNSIPMDQGPRWDGRIPTSLRSVSAGTVVGFGLLVSWALMDRALLADVLGSWSLIGANIAPFIAGLITGYLTPMGWKGSGGIGAITGAILGVATAVSLGVISFLDGLGNPIDAVELTTTGVLLIVTGFLLLVLPYFLIISAIGAVVGNSLHSTSN